MKNKYIYLSIEIFSREINGLLELSRQAISQNYQVILGDRQSFLKNIHNLPKGILFYKSASKIDEVYYNAFYRMGHKLSCLDAEGLIFHNFDFFFKNRLTIENLKKLDYYFLWGSKQQEIAIKKFPQFKEKFKITGGLNASNWIDDKKSIQKKNNNANIVFFTSFGSFNHFSINQEKENLEIKIYELDNNEIKYINDYSQFIKKLFFDYQKIIEKLANSIYPRKIFIKVHPSESDIPWKKLSRQFENIEITEKSVENLISEYEIIIQSESTTGVQAFIKKKKTFSYIPREYKDSKFPLEVIKKTSSMTYDMYQFISTVSTQKNCSNKIDFQYLSLYLNNLKDNNIAQKILENINNLHLSTCQNLKFYKTISYFKLSFFFIFCIIKSRFKIFFKILPFKFKQLVDEQFLAYGPPKTQFLYFLKFLYTKPYIKMLVSEIFKNKIEKKIEILNSYGVRKRKNFNKNFLLENFEFLLNYELKEIDKNLILIKNR